MSQEHKRVTTPRTAHISPPPRWDEGTWTRVGHGVYTFRATLIKAAVSLLFALGAQIDIDGTVGFMP